MKYLNKAEIDSAIEFAGKSSATMAEQIQTILVSTLKHAAEHGDCSQFAKLTNSIIENHPGKRLPHSVRPIIAWVANNAGICIVHNDKPREFKVGMVRNWKRKASDTNWKTVEETLWLDASQKRTKTSPDLAKLKARMKAAARTAIDEKLVDRKAEAIHRMIVDMENELLRELNLYAESAKELQTEAERAKKIKDEIGANNADLGDAEIKQAA